MRSSIRVQVTFTNEEVINILKKHLKKSGLVMQGAVELQSLPNMLTISNVEIFDEVDNVSERAHSSGPSLNEMYEHARRTF